MCVCASSSIRFSFLLQFAATLLSPAEFTIASFFDSVDLFSVAIVRCFGRSDGFLRVYVCLSSFFSRALSFHSRE